MPGVMVVLCEGKQSRGFTICEKCGVGGELATLSNKKKSTKSTHTNPHGVACGGTMQSHMALGHEFETDILRVQFLANPKSPVDSLWFIYSLAAALVEGSAEVLQVPAADISVTVGHLGASRMPPIILYDNVPGGAGLVSRLESPLVFQDVLRTALQRVSGQCNCGEDSSCYACLRSYRNQFAHAHMQRGPVFHYLRDVLERIEEQEHQLSMR